jgi:hypothetical protein
MVLLYIYTRTFYSSVWLYSQNSFRSYDGWNITTDAPMGFSAFMGNPGWWPEQWVAKVGNLKFYNEHACGGHFPGLANPEGLADDIRELATYFRA